VLDIDDQIFELAESKSVSYHGPGFFLEVLPRKHRLVLLLPLDFNEIDNSSGLAEDATQWKFFSNAKYEGGVTLRVNTDADIESAVSIVRQAYTMACA
jgi:predicted transport protein